MYNEKTRIEKVKEIRKFAEKNNHKVSYITVVDILKNKDDNVQQEDLIKSIKELIESGITVDPLEEGESYPSGEVEEAFIPAEVNIKSVSMNVYNLMERLENREIDLNPAFQRNSDLWTLENQSRLIESLMLKIPIPAFYFDASCESEWVVIDGLQRLTAFQNFLVGKSKEKFVGFQYLKDFDGFTFDELPRQYIRRVKEAPIIAYTVEKGTPDEIVFNIFQRINTGVLPLNDQEIRQALYHGKVTELIQELASTKEFLEATQYAIKTERMIDREYITRFIAFTELDYKKEYRGNIDNFLIKAMKKVNNYSESDLGRIRENFKTIMIYCNKIFGRYAFRKYSPEYRRGPINKAIFEMWAVVFEKLDTDELDLLLKNKESFLDAFQKLQNNKEFSVALKAGDQYSMAKRMAMALELVREYIC